MDKANELYIEAVKSGQRNLPDPLHWGEIGHKLNHSWKIYSEKFPDDVKEPTPFNKYMQYMYDNF